MTFASGANLFTGNRRRYNIKHTTTYRKMLTAFHDRSRVDWRQTENKRNEEEMDVLGDGRNARD